MVTRVTTVGMYLHKDLNERSPFLKLNIFRDEKKFLKECAQNNANYNTILSNEKIEN